MSPIPRPCVTCGALTPSGSHCPRCRSMRRGMSGWAWSALRAAVRARDGGCVRCGARHGLEVHHVVPLAEGGANEPANLVTLCRACHLGQHGGAVS